MAFIDEHRSVPVITMQPTLLSLLEGGTAEFRVTGLGANLVYQWKKNGVEIPGADSNTYRIPSITWNDTGDYTV